MIFGQIYIARQAAADIVFKKAVKDEKEENVRRKAAPKTS